MTKSRIIHIITGLNTGGAEMMLFKLLSMTDRTRFEHSVISLSDRGTIGDRIAALGIPVFAISLKNYKYSLSNMKQLVSTVRKLQPHLVQGWMYHGNLMAQTMKLCLPAKTTIGWNVRHSLYSLSFEKKAPPR